MNDNIISRRQFFKNGITKTIPFLACATIPSIIYSCGSGESEDDFSYEDNSNGNNNSSGNSNNDSSGISDATGTINGYGYVDLGLSVKWATCNLGAKKAEDNGKCYLFCTTTDYTVLYENGFRKGDSIAGTEYDHSIERGKAWRTPSKDDFQELIDNTTQEKYTYNGTVGIRFTSKKNGKSIFLPDADYYWYHNGEYELFSGNRGYGGEYWLSNIYLMGASTFEGYYFDWVSNHKARLKDGLYVRNKLPIRPVTTGSGTSTGCSNSCSSSCASNSTSNTCSNCGSNCSGNCKSSCDYNCAATCKSHCYGSCNDTCGGTCKYLSAGTKCSGCATTCNGRCYHTCSYACSTNCQSSCVNGSK